MTQNQSSPVQAPPPGAALTPADYSEHDRRIWDEELAGFVPSRVFDAHCHMLRAAHFDAPSPYADGKHEADLHTLRRWAAVLYPGRQMGFLTLGIPIRGINPRRHEDWCFTQFRGQPTVRHNRLVTPSCKLADIERDLDRPGCIGLKPYRVFSVTGDMNQCRIHEFLPHEQMELANARGCWVTMHLSRYHGCADELNLADLTEYTTKRYPRIRWILAHCARSFTYWPIRRAVERLRDLPNIWYDTSAVNDLRPHLTLFQKEDHRRIFYGSDGVDATYFRGAYAPMGRYWGQFEVDAMKLPLAHTDARPVLAITGQLLDMKHAAEIAGLSRDQVEDIFWRNATREFGVAWG